MLRCQGAWHFITWVVWGGGRGGEGGGGGGYFLQTLQPVEVRRVIHVPAIKWHKHIEWYSTNTGTLAARYYTQVLARLG